MPKLGHLPEPSELLEGRSLDRAIRQDAPFATRRTLHIMAQMADSLAEAPMPKPQLVVAASMAPYFPMRSILSLFPDEPRTHLYATVIGGALIILMFEVVIR